MSISVSTTAGNSVQVTVNGKSTAEVITQTSTVTVTPASTNAVTVTSKGPKGDTGETGATGPTGPAGADGAGVIAAGAENQFLQKNSATDYDTKWSAYTLPGTDGDARQVLTTDGAGVVSFAYPQTIAEDVKNVSGGPLSKGTPVHVTGSVGNLAEVIAADAATNYPAHFVLDEDLVDEGEGKGIALGFINNVDVPDASIYTEGQTVYLAAAGGWTTTKPTGTNAIQNLGIIIKVNVSGNKISGIIMGAGRSNDVPNIPNGQTWIGNASGVATPTTLATVATTGSYNDLSDQPTIPTDTNLGNADQTLSGTRVVDQQGENFEIDVNGGQFDLNDLTHNYISASSSQLSLQGIVWPASDGTNGQVLQTSGAGALSFVTPTTPSRGGTYSYSGYSTDTNATTTFYYQFPSATSTSSTTDMISGFVGQGVSNATYGTQGGITLDGLSSTDQVTYSITVKVTTNTTIAIQTLCPNGGQFTPATQFAFSSPSEQTFTLTQASPTPCNNQGGVQWVMGMNIIFFAGGSISFRVEDFSITVS